MAASIPIVLVSLLLINVPKRVYRFFEFYKAPELIMLGRQIARDTLDKYESERG